MVRIAHAWHGHMSVTWFETTPCSTVLAALNGGQHAVIICVVKPMLHLTGE